MSPVSPLNGSLLRRLAFLRARSRSEALRGFFLGVALFLYSVSIQ